MVVSSRTPEGTPNHCPVCGNAVKVEPSLPFGDAPCPSCGTLLWFSNFAAERLFYKQQDSHKLQYRVLRAVADQLGVPVSELLEDETFLKDLQADSLDLIELVMEFEDESAV